MAERVMTAETFTAMMTAAGYEPHIVEQFNVIIDSNESPVIQERARKNAVVAFMEGIPYWQIGRMLESICKPNEREEGK